MDRRAFLHSTLWTSLSGLAACSNPASVMKVGAWAQDPFSLGVASGSPTADGMVLWTRLAPEPLHPEGSGGLPNQAIPVVWEIAEDEAFKKIVQKGTALAEPGLAHSVHIEVAGLAPDRWYFYRFHSGAATSPTGRTRTAPRAEARVRSLRFAYASCQHYEYGYFGAYQHMAREDVDFVAFLGDYIYEYKRSRDPQRVRSHPPFETQTLAEYRLRYALYKQDRDLQRMHAQVPWVVIWDDHEVSNDYANDQSQELAPNFLARRAAAYQAYYEHQPLRRSALQQAFKDLRIYGELAWGRLAHFYCLDDRQYRDPQACPSPGRGGSNLVNVRDCPGLSTSRSLLGAAQEQWLYEALRQENRAQAAARPTWNVLLQQTLFSSFNFQRPEHAERGPRVWTDGWDGYPAARTRLLDALVAGEVANPVLIGGDVHANYVAEIAHRGRAVATEFCGTSLTSKGALQSQVDAWLPSNPHIKFGNAEKRGYGIANLTPARLDVSLRVVDDVRQPEPQISTLAQFTVEAGRAEIKVV